jgi:opacity protein-like surface antigen
MAWKRSEISLRGRFVNMETKGDSQIMQYKHIIALCVLALLLTGLSALPAAAEVGFGLRGGMMIPDQEPFNDEFDSNYILGGVLELDSNLGLTLEATVEYFSQDSDNAALGGEISIVPIMFSAKYNFLPRYRSTPFVGIGAGAFFFDRDYDRGSKTKTRFGARVSAGFRFLEDRGMNVILEGARNFTDFDGDNASSFQVTFGLVFDLPPSLVGISQ